MTCLRNDVVLAPLEFVGPGPNGEAGSFLLRQRSSSCFAIENLYGLWSHDLVCGSRMERDIWKGSYDEGRKIL